MSSAMEHIVNQPRIELRPGQPQRMRRRLLDIEHNVRLIEEVKRRLNVRTDQQLSGRLYVTPSAISKIRLGYSNLGAAMAIRIHEVAGISFREMREILEIGDLTALADDRTSIPTTTTEVIGT